MSGTANLAPSADAPGNERTLAAARAVLDSHWRDGYAVPHAMTYPWQWLWDSCFHAVIWAALGDDRAVEELATALGGQNAEGFVPHMRYHADPEAATSFWRRSGSSSITQPPMYGHAVAQLVARGFLVPDEIVERARHGLEFLLRRRARDDSGLVRIVHPWESGCDDSPRWDHWCPGGFDPLSWRVVKGELVAAVEHSATGSAVSSDAFRCAPVGFNALVAFNASELASVTGDGDLAAAAAELADAIDARWDDDRRTWVDGGDAAATSGSVRTVEALLAALVVPAPRAAAAIAEMVDVAAFGAPFGPAQVHRDEPTRDPSAYWRGGTWPQLAYLCWVAARRCGASDHALELGRALVAGAHQSGHAEYWDPDDGRGLGAIPQSWTGLAAVVASATTA